MHLFKKILNTFIDTFFIKYKFELNPHRNKNYYLKIYKKLKSLKKIENFINKKKDINIHPNWFYTLALHTQVVEKKEINIDHGPLLYFFLLKYLKKKKEIKRLTILETGTARGYSSICMSKCLNDFDVIGKIHTIDILPHETKMYWNCIDDIEGKKTRKELLKPWSKELENIYFHEGRSKKILKFLKLERIHFAFLDGSHNKRNIQNEFKYILLRQKKNDQIFFDDVTKSLFPDIYEFVKNIENDYPYKVKIISNNSDRGYALATRK